MSDDAFKAACKELEAHITQMRSVFVALSGGVDSSVLTAICRKVLVSDVVAATAVSPTTPEQDLEAAKTLCKKLGIEHLHVHTQELSLPRYIENTPERCYFCKQEIFQTFINIAKKRSIALVADGATKDDLASHRPGMRATKELGVVSPLLDAGITKPWVKMMANDLGLANAIRPSSACLSTRIAYGIPITEKRLACVKTAEDIVRSFGFSDVRVRMHQDVTRIEVPFSELPIAAENASVISDQLKQLGLCHVSLDLQGLRSGSMLETLEKKNSQ